MTAPLNGLLLNGGTSYATWAWGWARAEATATAEPVVYRIHRYVDGVALGEATSSGITDRLAFLDGEKQPYAEMAMVATRLAYFDAVAVGTAEEFIDPVRTAYFDGVESATASVGVVAVRYADMTAEVARTAVVVGSAERTAWMSHKTVDASAGVNLVATRLAKFDGIVGGTAQADITLARVAWFDALSMSAAATSSSYYERWKTFGGQALALAEASRFEPAIRRRMFGKDRPAQARTWVAEARIRRIRVRQIYAKSDAVARARTRALANTALGFGKMGVGAETTADDLKINIYHGVRGRISAGCELSVDASRVRIIIGGMPCEAFVRAAPTITREGVRYSYNSGTSPADAVSAAHNKVFRSLYPAIAAAISETSFVDTFLVRGVRGVQVARAEALGDQWFFTRVRAAGRPMVATASSAGGFNRYRWSPIEPMPATAQADSFSTNSVAAYSNEAVFPASAATQADYAVVRWQAAVAEAKAVLDGTLTHLPAVYAEAVADARAVVDGTLTHLPAVYAEAVADAVAVDNSTAVRWAGVDANVSAVADVSGYSLRLMPFWGDTAGEAETSGIAERHAYLSGVNESAAVSLGAADRTARMSHKTIDAWAETASFYRRSAYVENQGDSAVSDVAISANIYTWRYWGEQVLEAEAESEGDPWRITTAVPISDDATAAAMRFVFRINIDSLAPTRRTVELTQGDRRLALPASSREYRVA